MTWQNQQSECAPSEDSDQPGHPPSLIRVFAGRMKKAKALIRLGGCPGWSEASLGAHSFCWFCHVAAHMCLASFLFFNKKTSALLYNFIIHFMIWLKLFLIKSLKWCFKMTVEIGLFYFKNINPIKSIKHDSCFRVKCFNVRPQSILKSQRQKYYLGSEQQRRWSDARIRDLCLCFSIMHKASFLIMWLILWSLMQSKLWNMSVISKKCVRENFSKQESI